MNIQKLMKQAQQMQEKLQEEQGALTVEASVTDVNGQQVSNRTATVVHKGEFYVGVAPRGYLAEVRRYMADFRAGRPRQYSCRWWRSRCCTPCRFGP